MPTVYTYCHECHNDTYCIFNKTHIENIQIRNFLFNKGLPEEICQFILLKYVNTLTKCSFCNIKLCDYHGKRAIKNGQYYKKTLCLMCDNCCWNYIG